ncbi:uncharacterized protein C8Q71DRAFT_710867, partial [Rhodofomes roseus]
DTLFCTNETFVQVWFAFTRLQLLDSGMQCPTCGPSPKIIIADGVSLATHVSKLTASVRPPTFTDGTSEVVESISSYKARSLPAIVQKDHRNLVNKVLDSGAAKGLLVDDLPDLSGLASDYPAMTALLRLILNPGPEVEPHICNAYRELARQIAAPDIVLQLVPHKAIALLHQLASEGHTVDWFQSLCPVIGRIVEFHQRDSSIIPVPVIDVLAWLANRAEEVYNRLAQHDPAPTFDRDAPVTGPQASWTETGTCYGLPAVRSRRVYSKLRHDTQATDLDPDEMGDCNKFYKTYSRNNLTGGILVLWCTHSVCIGFHTIPIAEGRNDVFSAIYTHFPQAPDIIIYDFACQLAPYCLVREARYFANTRFLIDELHAHDHTRCGRACFASNTMQYDDRVRAVNTSAAECGNKGIGRIRKSVSYMGFEHAVTYTKVFLDVWNRMVLHRIARTA